MLRVIATIMSDVETIVGCSRIYAMSFCGERDDVFGYSHRPQTGGLDIGILDKFARLLQDYSVASAKVTS